MAVAVVLYSCCNFTEAIQENFIISTVLLIIPEQRQEMITLPVILTDIITELCTCPSSETQKSFSGPCHLKIHSEDLFLKLELPYFFQKQLRSERGNKAETWHYTGAASMRK